MNDVSQASAEATAVTYKIPGNTAFIEYIRTLGIKDYSGTDKPAVSIIKGEVEKRNW